MNNQQWWLKLTNNNISESKDPDLEFPHRPESSMYLVSNDLDQHLNTRHRLAVDWLGDNGSSTHKNSNF